MSTKIEKNGDGTKFNPLTNERSWMNDRFNRPTKFREIANYYFIKSRLENPNQANQELNKIIKMFS